MNNLQRFFVAVAFTFVLALPTYAGDMDCPVAPPPPPTSSQMQGDMPTGPGATTEDGSLSEVVWGVLEGVLALL